MRHQLKAKTPSARARMSYILRTERYGVKAERAAELVAAGVANLPSWADGPAAFWSAVDGFERKNSRLCLELELNLPRELSRERQVAAVADYIDRLTTAAGAFPITWAIHDANDGNPHCHLMLQERALDGRARGPREHFKRANSKNPEQGGVVKSRWWHDREHVFWSRALWADACNQQLLAEGQAARFDPRRKSQRLDEALRAGDLRKAAALCTQTERHEGPAVASARRKLAAGRVQAAELAEQVMQIISGNDQARGFNCWLRDWSRTASEKELQLFLADHLRELKQRLEAESPSGHIQARAAWMEQQHAEALADDRQRAVAAAQQAGELELLTAAQIEQAERAALAAELAELIALEQGDQLDDLLAIEVEQAHGAALAEDAQRTAELAELVAGEQAVQAGDLGHLGAVQAAHTEALVEDARRTAELERMHDRLRHQLRHALAEGAIDRAGGQAVLDRLVGADADGIRRAVVGVAELRAELAELVQVERSAQVAELSRLAAVQAVQADDLVDQFNQRLARLGLHQLAELDLDDPATFIHHDEEPQRIEVEGQDGDVLGDPDTQWRYDHEAGDWVEHDPDDRPSRGPRMG